MALTKIIRNASTQLDTWCGQEIGAGASYTLQSQEDTQWASDTKVNLDVMNEVLVVNDGVSDLTSVAGLDWIRANVPVIQQTIPANEFGMQMRGVMLSTPPNTTNYVDLKLENYSNYPNPGQNEAYTTKFIWGGYAKLLAGEPGDRGRFQLVDVDNILGYGAGFIAREYIIDILMWPNGETINFVPLAPGEVPIGLYLRAIVTTTNAGSTRTLLLNYDIETRG
jgi:hypothetical protein